MNLFIIYLSLGLIYTVARLSIELWIMGQHYGKTAFRLGHLLAFPIVMVISLFIWPILLLNDIW